MDVADEKAFPDVRRCIHLSRFATAAGAQVVVDHGYYPGGGMVVLRGAPVYHGAYVGGVRAAATAGVLVPTATGPQWRKVNACHVRVRVVPTYPIWHPSLTAYY